MEKSKKKQKVWQCEHPKDQQFRQITNYGVKYDLIYCRSCGELVEKEPKENKYLNVS